MGLLDDMANEMKETSEKPDGWFTRKELEEMVGLGRNQTRSFLDKKVGNGELVKRTVTYDGKRQCIYGPPD